MDVSLNDLDVSGYLNVQGDTTLVDVSLNDLDVSGHLTIVDVSLNDLDVSGYLNVQGNTTLVDVSLNDLDVSGNLTTYNLNLNNAIFFDYGGTIPTLAPNNLGFVYSNTYLGLITYSSTQSNPSEMNRITNLNPGFYIVMCSLNTTNSNPLGNNNYLEIGLGTTSTNFYSTMLPYYVICDTERTIYFNLYFTINTYFTGTNIYFNALPNVDSGGYIRVTSNSILATRIA